MFASGGRSSIATLPGCSYWSMASGFPASRERVLARSIADFDSGRRRSRVMSMSTKRPLWSDCGPSMYDNEPADCTARIVVEQPNMWSMRRCDDPM